MSDMPASTADHPAAAADEPTEAAERRATDLRVLEALIFSADHPLDRTTLAVQVRSTTEIDDLLADLAALYRHRGVNLIEVAGGFAFRTAPDLADRLTVRRVVRRKLSRAALETLAIIAYHQPVTRAEIEEIRGVGLSRGTLDLLLEAEWIAPKGRRRSPGRPVTWVTTPAFLEHFGLASLDDLPGVDELKAAGLLDLADARIGERADDAGDDVLPLPFPTAEDTADDGDDADDNGGLGATATDDTPPELAALPRSA